MYSTGVYFSVVSVTKKYDLFAVMMHQEGENEDLSLSPRMLPPVFFTEEDAQKYIQDDLSNWIIPPTCANLSEKDTPTLAGIVNEEAGNVD